MVELREIDAGSQHGPLPVGAGEIIRLSGGMIVTVLSVENDSLLTDRGYVTPIAPFKVVGRIFPGARMEITVKDIISGTLWDDNGGTK